MVFFHWEGTREEIPKYGAHGCGFVPSDDMVFHYVPIVITANEKGDLETVISHDRVAQW